MIRNIVLAAAVLCAASCYAQRAVRATVTHAENTTATNSFYRFSDSAQMGDAAFSIAWLSIDATNSVSMDIVASDGSYTNALQSVGFTEAGTSNFTYYTETTLGEWPCADRLMFSTELTNDGFTVRMLLRVTK